MIRFQRGTVSSTSALHLSQRFESEGIQAPHNEQSLAIEYSKRQRLTYWATPVGYSTRHPTRVTRR